MNAPGWRRPAALAVLLLVGICGRTYAQSAENVLLVVNRNSIDSVQIGQYYARKRAVPRDQIVAVSTAVEDEIARSEFEQKIETPLAQWMAGHAGHDRILYIVLTKGVPLRISGTGGKDGTIASVDSELTLLYRKLTGRPTPLAGPVPNPYFLGSRPVDQARPFSHADYDIFLVTRLDGFTVRDVLGLIDRGFSPSRDGRILLDQKDLWQDTGNAQLKAAADVLSSAGFKDRVVLDSTLAVLHGEDRVLGYYSWGSNDPANRLRHLDLQFVPGAIGGMFVSSDGRTFDEPPAGWKIGSWGDQKSYFAGSPQSLAGDLIRDGITGIAAHVSEPYLEATARPDILFPAYLSGLNLAESFYSAVPYLSWQTVVVGDPLCAPFRMKTLRQDEIHQGLDAVTQLPAHFSARRLAAASAGGAAKPEAIKLALRAEALLAKDERTAAMQALEQATTLDDRLTASHFMIALMYTQSGEFGPAVAHYRRLLAQTPDNAAALNNLAYLLAVRQNAPGEALPLAKKAYAISRGAPVIADTLGWITHLAGDEPAASRLLEDAVKAAPQNFDIRLHAAVVYAATGRFDESREELRHALELNPDAAKNEEVRKLRERLSTP